MMRPATSSPVLILVMSLTACGGSKPEQRPAPAADPAPAPAAEPAPSTPPAAAAAAPGANPHAGGHGAPGPVVPTPVAREDEPHLKNIKQLTFGGENAEAYWSKDGSEFTFQSRGGDTGLRCDGIFRMNADGSNKRQVSVGNGRTTCAYIQNDGATIYASTHGHGEGCLADADMSKGYVWMLYPEMDIWTADKDGKKPKVLFQSKGYDAEATVCRKDGRVIFTSDNEGDLELYVMDKKGKNVTRLTTTPGYDGGAFFSPDCTKIIWRASRPEGAELEDFKALLAQHMVRPSKLEIFVMDIDAKNKTSNVVQVTKNGKANFAPYMHPDNKRLLFVSNQGDPKGRDFDVYLINVDGTGEQKITHNPTFDGFPMWTDDGKKLIFASNRAQQTHGDTNLFVADWVD